MKLSKIQLKEYILTEVKKIATEEGWISAVSVSEEKNENKNVEEIAADSSIVFEDSNKISEEIEKVELNEVKILAEEIKRMKELVDFRSPLLKKDF